MFAAGDLVIYGGNGVCEVTEVGPLRGSRGAERKRLYYTLRPRSGTETIYAPVDTPVYMRGIISREEAERLIDCIPELSVQVWQRPQSAGADRPLQGQSGHPRLPGPAGDSEGGLPQGKASGGAEAQTGPGGPAVRQTGGGAAPRRTGGGAGHSGGGSQAVHCRPGQGAGET